MKKITILALLLFFTHTFSQNLVITKRDYTNNPYTFSLQTLNTNTGQVINSIDYETDSEAYYPPKSLSFNPQTNEIVGMGDDKIIFKNIEENLETSFSIPEYYYQGAIIADNRLFVTVGNIIQEMNTSNGNIINTHNLTIDLPSGYYNRNLTYSSTTKDIYGLSENIIFKFNIITNQETTLVLPELLDNGYYIDVIIAENRLFVNKRDWEDVYDVHTLLEINTENGSIINTYTYTTDFESYGYMRKMTFLADTKEICTKIEVDNPKIIKYNINTGIESSFNLPSLSDGEDYGEIVSIITEENLSMPELNQENQAKVIKAYNLLGQEVPIETYNQIIILKYDNGKTKKVYIKK